MWTPGSGPARFPQSRRPRFAPLLPPLWLLLLVAVGPARGWESGDLELFDLVEEVQLNFYQFLGVQQVRASAQAGPRRRLCPLPPPSRAGGRTGPRVGLGAHRDPLSLS